MFFKEIKNGIRKDEALQKSKLDFLAQHPHDEAHPVYWAAVTAYGDMAPIRTDINWRLWTLLLLGVLCGSVFFWRRRKRA